MTPDQAALYHALHERRNAIKAWRIARNRLIVALPKRDGVNLFEPPSFRKPVEGSTLGRLHDDIAAAFRMADAVIELAFRAHERAAEAGRLAAPPSATAD
jgi:hypothetical protein